MTEVNVQDGVKMKSVPNGGKIGNGNGDDPPKAFVGTDPSVAPKDDGPGWWIRNANELVSICAVVLVLILAFGALSAWRGTPPPWNSNSWQFLVTVGVATVGFLGMLLFAFLAAKGERMMQDRAPHVLSMWSLRTLKAAGLPRDLSARLQEILEQAAEQSLPPTALTVIGRERVDGSWISDLESTFGKSRVAEYEEMLFKYTARQPKD